MMIKLWTNVDALVDEKYTAYYIMEMQFVKFFEMISVPSIFHYCSTFKGGKYAPEIWLEVSIDYMVFSFLFQ